MDNSNSKQQNNGEKEAFPQYLCKMCGRCCKAIVPEYSHEELEKLAEQGDSEARVFTEFFNRYPTLDDAMKVVPEHVNQIIQTLKDKGSYNEETFTVYYCPYITENNMCSIHEQRPDCCRRAPRHGWSLMPPGCGFDGWRFEMREQHKKTIRSLKEYLYEVKQLSPNGVIPGQKMTVNELENLINEKIKPWEKYGSRYW